MGLLWKRVHVCKVLLRAFLKMIMNLRKCFHHLKSCCAPWRWISADKLPSSSPWVNGGYPLVDYRELSLVAVLHVQTDTFVLQCLLTSANTAYPKSTFHWSKLTNIWFSMLIPDVAGLQDIPGCR